VSCSVIILAPIVSSFTSTQGDKIVVYSTTTACVQHQDLCLWGS